MGAAEVEEFLTLGGASPKQVQFGYSRRGGSCRSGRRASRPGESFIGDVRISCRREQGREPIGKPEKIRSRPCPAGPCPASERCAGTRKPPFIDRALGGPEWSHAAVGPSQGEHLRAVIGREDDDGVVGDAEIVEGLHRSPTSSSSCAIPASSNP